MSWKQVLLLLVGVKFVGHVAFNGLWSFHRDELLYLALGRHLDWGYSSVPPGIGFWAWVAEDLLGGSVHAIRFIATLFGCGILVFTGLMARSFLSVDGQAYNGRYAIWIVGLAGLSCGAFLRPAMLFMPVVFDVFYWTVLCWLFLQYINTANARWLLGFGLLTGIGLLNKYTVLIFLFAMLPGLLQARHRLIFAEKKFYAAIGLALLLVWPNLNWQISHDFPVMQHMTELAATQFVHVSLGSFLADQVFFFFPALPVWGLGLYQLLVAKSAARWRIFGLMYFMVLGVLLFFNAKSYYSLGAYPVLIAAGAAYWEKNLQHRPIALRWALPVWMIGVGWAMLPAILPVLPPAQEAQYLKKLAQWPPFEGLLRWEDGRTYALPQDFADMLGWEELSKETGKIWLGLKDPSRAAIYAENYGQAGAIEHFGQAWGAPPVWSFSDNYAYWLPDSIPSDLQTFIYINDELGDDMPGFFQKIELVWQLDMPLSRQHGDQIYLCQFPTPAFFERMRRGN